MPILKISILAAIALAIALPAHADQVIETRQHASAAECQVHAAVAAGELGKRFKVMPIMQTRSAVLYKVAYGSTTAFLACEGPSFKAWVM